MEEQRQRAGLEDYRIVRVVGKGSYGEVSLATHCAEGRQVKSIDRCVTVQY